jgi:hypothetical protein
MRQRWPSLAIGALVVLGLGLAGLLASGRACQPAWTAATPQATGTGVDQLTANEQAIARDITLRSLPTAVDKTDIQYLFAERHEFGKAVDPLAADRRADVYLYDYEKDRAIRRVVNLETEKVESTTTFVGQPPIAPGEATRAVELVIADEDLGASLRNDYQKVTGKELTSASQLRSQAIRFSAAQAVGAKNEGEFSECGVHRCVQLFIEFPNGQWVDTSRLVVDLSADRVRVLNS